MQSKRSNLILVLIFMMILLFPVLFVDRTKGGISVSENRNLAEFPIVFHDDGKLNRNLRVGFTDWLNDHIGFKNSFIKCAAKIKLNLFGISTSEKVHIGKDGWFFYTGEQNLEIANGMYYLTDEMLEEIAEKQQFISDYYKDQGIQYILALTPSKVSIYPEKIGTHPSGGGCCEPSPCDIVERYLNEHTDVMVINVKPANWQAKTTEQQFLKTDTHWTQAGAYRAYCAIIEYFNRQKILCDEPIEVTLGETQAVGDLANMLGAGVLPPEVTSTVNYSPNAYFIKEGELFDQIEQLRLQDRMATVGDTVFLKNDRIPGGTLFISGDSQWMTTRNIPQLLGEHFYQTIMLRTRTMNIAIDQAVKPDVILFGCSERTISSILCADLTLPKLERQLPDLPEKSMEMLGLYMDWYNGSPTPNKDIVYIDKNLPFVKLEGWAVDFAAGLPLNALYLQIGNRIILCDYGIERIDVAEHFQNEFVKSTGFSVTFPSVYLQGIPEEELRFIQVSSDGTYRYKPVCFQVEFS